MLLLILFRLLCYIVSHNSSKPILMLTLRLLYPRYVTLYHVANLLLATLLLLSVCCLELLLLVLVVLCVFILWWLFLDTLLLLLMLLFDVIILTGYQHRLWILLLLLLRCPLDNIIHVLSAIDYINILTIVPISPLLLNHPLRHLFNILINILQRLRNNLFQFIFLNRFLRLHTQLGNLFIL